MRAIILTFLLVGSYLLGFSQSRSYKTATNISYVEKPESDYQSTRCRLDIHYPTSGEKKPIVIWYHGGGLTGGDREVPEFLREKGYVIVGVGYRFADQVKVEEIIQDAAKAVAYMARNGQKYHGDTSNIFLSGHSAGGYLTLMLGLNKAYLEREGYDADKLAGVISFSGHGISHFAARQEKNIPEKQPLIDEYAPLFWARKSPVPFILLTGDRELEMLGRYEENAYLKRMLLINGHTDVKLMEFQGYGHGMTHPGFPILLQEMERILKSKTDN
ncbi:alpha/beta hydrolase fold domain-containing protein [Sphingobacterium shayense]|uniref:alpha/beta hydrolase n=1 Tax=Sphingobacterium shayense TaxID=626343 RepID=UPI00155476D6|nr:alpha/beta hydrolase [Sphingobacterium shayense]NQD69842.1 alpha/beta hydrolase fold domain-containing protein [Sphingobacterium shayense]